MKAIDEIYAYISIDGDEGIPAFNAGGMMMPLIGADIERSDSIKMIAREIVKTTGKEMKLYKFSQRELIEVIHAEKS